jgi:hypothetical protein
MLDESETFLRIHSKTLSSKTQNYIERQIVTPKFQMSIRSTQRGLMGHKVDLVRDL